MENYNDILRKKFVDLVMDLVLKKMYTLDEAFKDCVDMFYSIDEKSNPYHKVLKQYRGGLLYLDSYKLCVYKMKKNICTDLDKDVFSRLYLLEDYVDLMTEYSADPAFFLRVMKRAFEAMQLNSWGRTLLVYSLTEAENAKILEMFPQHQQDIDSYKNICTLESLLNKYNYEEKYFKAVMSIEFKEGIIMEVAGFIRELKNFNESNAKRLCLEIAKDDCLALNFIRDIIDSDEVKNRCLFYEENDSIDIVDKLLEDEDLLRKSLEMVVSLNLTCEYEGIELDKETISSEKNDIVSKLVIK